MAEEQEYTERDIERFRQEGDQYVARAQYTEAVKAFVEARNAALACAAAHHLNTLDRLILRARDQAVWYARVNRQRAELEREAVSAALLAGLQQMGDTIGQTSAMDYRDLSHRARAARHAVVIALEPQNIASLAQSAMERQDYGLVIELLEGVSHDDSPTYTLLQRARKIQETDIDPRLLNANQNLTQSQPLDALGPLQDLRRDYASCPAWRELWFKAGRVQGEFLLESGRQSISERAFTAARAALKDAFRAFERGGEAYPGTSSTQMLLAEAQDLREIASAMDSAYASLQAPREAEAWQQFAGTLAKLDLLAAEGREYSLIRYEVSLNLNRLGGPMGQEKQPTQPEVIIVAPPAQKALEQQQTRSPEQLQKTADDVRSVSATNRLTGAAAVTQSLPIASSEGEVAIKTLTEEADTSRRQGTESRRIRRRLWGLIETGEFEQARDALAEAESMGFNDSEVEVFERAIQAGLRLASGRKLLEQGEIDLALSRFKSAAALAENQPGVEMIFSDAQVWANRAAKKLEQPSNHAASVVEPYAVLPVSASSDMLGRMMEWTMHVEPALAQARASFVNGNRQAAAQQLFALSRELEPTSAVDGEAAPDLNEGDIA